ncbi:MAG TPA: FlgD immunoglobulin-like domain containing protein, partial [Bacteroidota bacterium]|nr:FlgD immunoglobulin-like domain containing protein [Bacteroidota bacterium]
YELPPAPPAGQLDVRFTSQRMVETHPAEFKEMLSYPIQVKSVAYPITIDWNIKKDCNTHYELVYLMDGKEVGKRAMSGSNRIRVQQAVDQIIIRARMIESEIPSVFALRQNYPNPFNPSTVIQYELPMNAHVTLTIFNVAGQEVTRLIDGNQSAGYHSVSWDARNLSEAQLGTGVYFYQLVATDINNPTESYRQVRKMLLVK